MKYIKLIIISMILIIFLTSCTTANVGKDKVKDDEISVSKVINHEADRSREVYKTSNINVDYDGIKCPTSKELYKNASLIVEGVAQSSKTTLGPSGIANSLVTFKISNTYKGSYKENIIVVSFIGGYVNGEDYLNNISDEEFPIKVGGERDKLEEEVKGKILSLNIFKGETIPETGKKYLMFLGEKSEFLGSRHGVIGMEYEQGLFEIHDGRVDEFNPVGRENNAQTNLIDINNFIEEAKTS